MRKVTKEVLLVDSEAIRQIHYDREKRVLLVWFKNGTVYSYWKVQVRLFQRMRNSYSIGKFFNKHIKGKYKHKITTI